MLKNISNSQLVKKMQFPKKRILLLGLVFLALPFVLAEEPIIVIEIYNHSKLEAESLNWSASLHIINDNLDLNNFNITNTDYGFFYYLNTTILNSTEVCVGSCYNKSNFENLYNHTAETYANFVPYTGATQDVDLGGHNLSLGHFISFDGGTGNFNFTTGNVFYLDHGLYIIGTNGFLDVATKLLVGGYAKIDDYLEVDEYLNVSNNINILGNYPFSWFDNAGAVKYAYIMANIEYFRLSAVNNVPMQLNYGALGSNIGASMDGTSGNWNFTHNITANRGNFDSLNITGESYGISIYNESYDINQSELWINYSTNTFNMWNDTWDNNDLNETDWVLAQGYLINYDNVSSMCSWGGEVLLQNGSCQNTSDFLSTTTSDIWVNETGDTMTGGLLNATYMTIGTESVAGLFRVAKSADDNNVYIDTYDNGGLPPGKQSILNFRRSDSDSIGTNDATSTGFALGKIIWWGNKGTGFVEGASIYAIQDGNIGGTYVPASLYLTTSTDMAENTNQLVLNGTSGFVGINTSVPTHSLNVVGILNATEYIGDGAELTNINTYNESYDFNQSELWDNHTLITYNLWNDVWIDTYNSTYDLYALNFSLATLDMWNDIWNNTDLNETDWVLAQNYLTSCTETDPVFIAENSSLWEGIWNKSNATYELWAYNQTELTTYNATYDLWAYNQTELTTYNSTYDLWAYNQTELTTYNSTYDIWAYNQTELTTYNATYELWSYNQSTAVFDMYDTRWLDDTDTNCSAEADCWSNFEVPGEIAGGTLSIMDECACGEFDVTGTGMSMRDGVIENDANITLAPTDTLKIDGNTLLNGLWDKTLMHHWNFDGHLNDTSYSHNTHGHLNGNAHVNDNVLEIQEGDFITIPTTETYKTFSFWFKTNHLSYAGNLNALWSDDAAGSNPGDLTIFLDGIINDVLCYYNNGYSCGTATVTIDEWHHVVGVADGSRWTFYFDTIKDGSGFASDSEIGGASDLYIGSYATTNTLNASIDDVRVYDRVLTYNEILRLYQEKKDKFYSTNIHTDTLIFSRINNDVNITWDANGLSFYYGTGGADFAYFSGNVSAIDYYTRTPDISTYQGNYLDTLPDEPTDILDLTGKFNKNYLQDIEKGVHYKTDYSRPEYREFECEDVEGGATTCIEETFPYTIEENMTSVAGMCMVNKLMINELLEKINKMEAELCKLGVLSYC